MKRHFKNLACERSPFVNPHVREHKLKVSATCAQDQFTFELALTHKASNNTDTDMNASAMRQSHQAKLVQLTVLPSFSGAFPGADLTMC